MENFRLWENDPASPLIHFYPAKSKRGNGTVIIFPGGGYGGHTRYEGADFALRLNEYGMNTFTVDYRVAPNRHPLPMLDARRAIRFVRANAERFGIDPEKIAVMGSSAGGHLAASVSTYREKIEGEGVDALDDVCSIPNAQILCYPVIALAGSFGHHGSAINLLADRFEELGESLSPNLIADELTPPAFIWHTSSDAIVSVVNSYRYAEKLHELGIPVELHVYPIGEHGLGLANGEGDRDVPYVTTWAELLERWLILMNFTSQA